MFFYLVLFFSACLFAFLYSREKRQHVAILWKFICFSILFIPAALRFNVGVDYPTYAKIFNYIANGVPILVEPGYWFLNYAVFKLNGGFQIVVAFCSFFTLLFVFLSFPKKTFSRLYSDLFLSILSMDVHDNSSNVSGLIGVLLLHPLLLEWKVFT
jgi:hypothetical protein